MAIHELLLLPVLAFSLAFVGCDKDEEAPANKETLTAAECEAKGGKVVGDIGDGAVHRPDYKCPDSGKAPIATIVADKGGPVAAEGAVCCQ